MPAPPLRTEISDNYPLPSDATARSGFGKLWDYATGLLGSTGEPLEARAALGIVLPPGIEGLTLSTAGSSAVVSIAAGQARDSTKSVMLGLDSMISKNTSTWTAGTGNGGLDTGAIANNSWYHAFLILNPTTHTKDVVFSLSSTAPTLPSGYTKFRRLGSVKTNGSGRWVKFIQRENRFLWDLAVDDLGVIVVPYLTRVLYAISVPSGVQVTALVTGYVTGAGPGAAMTICSPDVRADSGVTTGMVPATNGYQGYSVEVDTNTAQLAVYGNTNSLAFNATAFTCGWIDSRGVYA